MGKTLIPVDGAVFCGAEAAASRAGEMTVTVILWRFPQSAPEAIWLGSERGLGWKIIHKHGQKVEPDRFGREREIC